MNRENKINVKNRESKTLKKQGWELEDRQNETESRRSRSLEEIAVRNQQERQNENEEEKSYRLEQTSARIQQEKQNESEYTDLTKFKIK